MALLTYCHQCKSDTLHNSYECMNCASIIKEQNKQAFLNERKKLSIEERLTLIESQLFDTPTNFTKDI